MAQKASIPVMERMQPETLMRSLLILMICWASLLSKESAGHGRSAGSRPCGRASWPPSVAFALELAAAGGVEGEHGGGTSGRAFQDFRVDGAVSGGAGGVRGLLQFQQRVDCLPRPDHVVCGAGLGDGGQLPKQVSIAQSAPGSAVVAVVGLPGVVAGDPGETPAVPRRRPCPRCRAESAR
jgi:hypothetical protein